MNILKQNMVRQELKHEKISMEFQSLKFGLIVKEARVFRKLTQDELAQKSGTTKSYISRIEHNASDIRLSTLNRILYEGLGGKLKFAIDF